MAIRLGDSRSAGYVDDKGGDLEAPQTTLHEPPTLKTHPGQRDVSRLLRSSFDVALVILYILSLCNCANFYFGYNITFNVCGILEYKTYSRRTLSLDEV